MTVLEGSVEVDGPHSSRGQQTTLLRPMRFRGRGGDELVTHMRRLHQLLANDLPLLLHAPHVCGALAALATSSLAASPPPSLPLRIIRSELWKELPVLQSSREN